MKCDKCGREIKGATRADPWRMYQFKDGKLIDQLFDPTEIPSDWYDSPKSAKAALENALIDNAKKVSKKSKKVAKDGNSTGLNQLSI